MADNEAKTGELITNDRSSTALSTEMRPTFIERSTEGTDEITSQDVRIPRLSIAQGLSNQMVPSDPAYIDNLKLFQMFNDLTGEIYGEGPLKFIPVRRDVRYIEFDPENRGSAPLDLDVPPNDPRTQWTTGDDGKRVPPAATRFVEFVCLLVKAPGIFEPIMLSIKETNKLQRKAAERLTGFIKMRQPPAPIYAGFYTVRTKPVKNDKGTFGVFIIDNAGYIQDEGTYNYAKAFRDSLEGKTIIVNREVGEDDDSFDVAAMGGDTPGGM